MIYFYHVGAYGYEDHIAKEYYSSKKYTQEEFETIIFNTLEKLMNTILEDEPTSICFYNIFFEPDDLLYEKKFDELMNEQGFYKVANQLEASVNFTLTNETNKYNNRLTKLFLDLDIDESCKEKNCNRLDDLDTKEKEYHKDKCGVAIREYYRRIKS